MGCVGTGKVYHLETSQKAHKAKGNQAGGSKTSREDEFFWRSSKTKSDWFCGAGEGVRMATSSITSGAWLGVMLWSFTEAEEQVRGGVEFSLMRVLPAPDPLNNTSLSVIGNSHKYYGRALWSHPSFLCRAKGPARDCP